MIAWDKMHGEEERVRKEQEMEKEVQTRVNVQLASRNAEDGQVRP
jgi:hypothetical protein